jgi:hypothetical protein
VGFGNMEFYFSIAEMERETRLTEIQLAESLRNSQASNYDFPFIYDEYITIIYVVQFYYG